jgi:signal transduction histidine kinase
MAGSAIATVREALSNVARHAQASRVEITVVAAQHTLTISVADDGVGVRPDVDQSGGQGLRNMRDRAERLGGTFRILSGSNNRGTVIEWILPLS